MTPQIKKDYQDIVDLSKGLFTSLSENRRKSLIFQLLNYLKVGNYQRVNNEVLRLLNVVDVNDPEKNKFIEKWEKAYCGGKNKEFEELCYCFIMGLLKIN